MLGSCWGSPRPKAPARDLTIRISVDHFQLENGLKVVVAPAPEASEVSVTVRYAVGTADDPVGREGLAHLLEHLTFEHVRDDAALFDILEDRALDFNGITTLDATLYRESGTPAQLEELLDLEAVRMGQACMEISEASFARQREIVRNELRERDSGASIQSTLHAAVYAKDHAFARRATVESVAAITRDEACAFAAKRYVPSNAVVVVSGPVTMRDVRQLLDKTIGRVPKAEGERPRATPYDPRARRVTVEGPVVQPWFVLAWPLPTDPIARTKVEAIAAMAATLVNARINGTTSLLELGAGNARTIAIAVAPSTDISFEDALDHAKDELSRMGPWFGSGIYEHVKSRAIYQFASSLETSLARDRDLAELAASNGDAGAITDDALRGLLAMSRDEADDLVRSALDPDKATTIVIRPSRGTTERVDTLAPPFHEERRRKTEDPAEARQQVANRPAPVKPFEHAQTYEMSNGLHVVLLPLSTMPTLEVRLALPVGTADERAGQRGIALIAADALDPPFDTEMYKFLQAGGRVDRETYFDQTVFSVRGLAPDLDVLLGGLATTLREGSYDNDSVRDAAKWHASNRIDAKDRAATSVWRDALYGANHPYCDASLWSRADRAARDVDAVSRFRRSHYVPDGATLVIAGQFDPSDASRWIDFHFKDWTGEAPERPGDRATLQPLAFAQKDDRSQIDVDLAFAAPGGDDVALAIVAEMLDEVIADVREQLAASYGLDATLVQRRLSSTIQLAGSIEASRAAEAMALLRDRLATLREGGDAAASRFVAARRHVISRLSSVDTRAASLADSVVDDLARTGKPRLTLAGADHAMSLTIDKIAPLLQGLDLSRAAIVARGPEPALRAAFTAIGRQPTFLK
ncbi:MAG: insulinase family protein [Kofleriaceae bacterium]|nr:insulinase family protein [Kofleriaceae bacterium]